MFYESIARVYDYIFPQNPKQLDFIQGIQPINNTEVIIDVGCATGNLTELLSRHSGKVIGIDLDQELLKFGKRKFRDLQLEHMDMLSINEKFGDGQIDRIVSFGNTLVHLPNKAMVSDFFAKVYATLKPGGLFIVQIINYDRIINQQISNLPTINNDHVTFIRDYNFNEHNQTVEFITKLTIKENDQVLHNSIPLLALRKEDIFSQLTYTGFGNIRFYGDLTGAPLNPSSVPLLFSCAKPNL